ncbi:MAG: hypothetical protein JWM09_1453 [Francisellaceae bacterium]|nr:hypothetical protein [Francisellaceae bacterium]
MKIFNLPIKLFTAGLGGVLGGVVGSSFFISFLFKELNKFTYNHLITKPFILKFFALVNFILLIETHGLYPGLIVAIAALMGGAQGIVKGTLLGYQQDMDIKHPAHFFKSIVLQLTQNTKKFNQLSLTYNNPDKKNVINKPSQENNPYIEDSLLYQKFFHIHRKVSSNPNEIEKLNKIKKSANKKFFKPK